MLKMEVRKGRGVKAEGPVTCRQMYIMGKCPWCAKAMEKIADSIKCDYTCSYQGQELTARLDFNVHMVRRDTSEGVEMVDVVVVVVADDDELMMMMVTRTNVTGWSQQWNLGAAVA